MKATPKVSYSNDKLISDIQKSLRKTALNINSAISGIRQLEGSNSDNEKSLANVRALLGGMDGYYELGKKFYQSNA